MRFIRKNGKIIPIREKGERKAIQGKLQKQDQIERKLTRQDTAVGFASGLTRALFFKKKVPQIVIGAGSAAHGLSTTIKRFKTHDRTDKAAWEDLKSTFMKAGASIAGQVTGAVSLVGLNKLNKIRKAGKMGAKGAKATAKIAKLLG